MKIDFDDGRFAIIDVFENEKGTFEYYNHGVFIGVYDPDVMSNKFLSVDIENSNKLERELTDEEREKINELVEKIKEKIELISREDIENDARANKSLDEYLEELGIDRKDVKVRDIDREKEKEKEKDEEELENEDKELDEEDREREDEKEKDEEELEEEEKDNIITRDDVSVKQEVDLSERANGMQDLAQWLGNRIPKNYTKLAAIPTTEMSQFKDEEGNTINDSTTRYSLVVISNDGRVEPLKTFIPELEQNNSVGNNPTKEEYQISTRGEVEKDSIDSEYRIGNKIFQIDKDPGDDMEINISKLGPFTNEKASRGLRGEQGPIQKPNREIEDAIGGGVYNSGPYAAVNSNKEIKEHDKAGDDLKDLKPKDYDGKEETYSHVHITEENIDYYVEKIKEETKFVENIFKDKEIAERLRKNLDKEGEKMNTDEIVEKTKRELEIDASNYPSREVPN